MEPTEWVIACRRPESTEWTACARARSAAEAHDLVIQIKEIANLRGGGPVGWKIVAVPDPILEGALQAYQAELDQ